MTNQQDERLGLPSASYMPIVANCPGAPNICKRVPKSEDPAKATVEGIDIHAAIERDEFDELSNTEKDIALRLKEMEKAALADFCSEYSVANPQILRETRLFIRDRNTLAPIASSKIDFGAIVQNSALVLDYKSGFLDPTPSERNWQCKTQAVSIWHENPDLTRVRAGIAASRLRDKLDLAEYDLSALRAAEWEILFVIQKSKAPDAPRYPGTWCRYCPAKAWCREYTAWASMEVVPFTDKSELAIYAAVQQLAPADLARIQMKAGTVAVLLKAVKLRLLSMNDAELSAIGLKRKPGNKPRKVVDMKAVREGLLKIMSVDELIERMSIGVGDIDELVCEKTGVKKKEAKDKVKELLGSALEEKENSPSIESL